MTPARKEDMDMLKRVLAMGLALALMLAGAALAETAELSDWYGKDIAQAAEAVGGLDFSAGEEFAENYEDERVALRGNDGKVSLIELKLEPSDWTLCGVSIGMTADEVKALMSGLPMMWEYDEEIAWMVQADISNDLNSVMLVVFFDEGGLVNGAWYRNAEA